jgi:hypothetical protein
MKTLSNVLKWTRVSIKWLKLVNVAIDILEYSAKRIEDENIGDYFKQNVEEDIINN